MSTRPAKPGSKRQIVEEARRAALEGRWNEAIELNQKLIERSPKDAEAYNRLGRALMASKHYGPAIDAFSNALRSDPANMIARRNLQRLELLRHRPVEETPNEPLAHPTPRTAVFIEEIGKTWVDELVNPAPMDELVEVTPGQQLQFEQVDDRLYVATPGGQRLGEIERKTAESVVALIEAGSQFEVYALGITTQSVRVILRDVAQDSAQGNRPSFPRQIKTRAYLRERDLLRQRDEADFLMFGDDEDEDEDEETTTEPVDDEEPADSDTEPFVDDADNLRDEEASI